MDRPLLIIIEFDEIYNILMELKSETSFNLIKYSSLYDFLKDIEIKKELSNSTILVKKNYKEILDSKILSNKSVLMIDNFPITINQLLDQINSQIIKQKYNFQSNFKIGKYSLDINSRIISKNGIKLNLTEREIDILLFLKSKNSPQKIENLQNKVWKYSSELETHTVETHIYRLRKKIKEFFKDDNFIISQKEGYLINEKT